MEPKPSFERDVNEIERKLNAQTQQHLIGQVNDLRAMIELHEKEMLMLWGGMAFLFIVVISDDLYLRHQIREMINA